MHLLILFYLGFHTSSPTTDLDKYRRMDKSNKKQSSCESGSTARKSAKLKPAADYKNDMG